MGHFLLFIFLLIIVVLFFGLSIITGFIRLLFGGRKNNPTSTKKNSQYQTPNQPNNTKQKKVIDSDEGEYIDFEEVKD